MSQATDAAPPAWRRHITIETDPIAAGSVCLLENHGRGP
jgi:hypothetical protein